MTPDIETVELHRHLRLLNRHRTLILACTLLGVAVALAMSFVLKRTYAADAALGISRSKIGESAIQSETLSTANFRPLIESRAVASQVIKETRLDEAPYWVSPSRFFSDVVEIEEVRNSSVLLVHGRLSDPTLVADIVNRVANLGTATARRVSQQEAVQARNDIKLQLDEAKARLDVATAKLDGARKAAQLELIKKDVDAELEQRGSLLDLQINIEAEKARLAKAVQELGSRTRIETVTRSIDASPAMMEAARSGDGTAKDLLALQMKNEEVNPVYQELDRQIVESRTRLAALERQKAQMTARRLDDPHLARLNDMYAKESEINSLEMERDLAKKVYQEVSNSYESARLLVAGRSSGLQILTFAIPPDKPESRKIPRNVLIGALSGFLLSCLLVLVRGNIAESSAIGPRVAAVREPL
jgi:uncharacterized protein involved in exopolysaccharide biosynthesis